MADTEPGLFETWWRTRKERKARQAMTTEMPPDIAAEITADAAGLNDPEPVRGRSESLAEFLRRTPHRYASDHNDRATIPACLCGLHPRHEIHDDGDDRDLLDTRAYVAARLEEIRAGLARDEALAEDASQETAETAECSRCGAALVRDEAGDWVRRDEPERGRGICRDNCSAPWLPHEPVTPGESPEAAAPPDRVLGYLVAYTYRADGGVEGVTHTTAMDLETARREARQYGVSPVRRWFPVELRRVDGA